jgi:predicted cobalt transporter CbtA
MTRKLLICGLLAGLVAGILAFGFQRLAGEPAVDQAIAYEEAHAPPLKPGEKPEAAPVSRDTQKSVGLLTATVVYGVALGGIFALVFAYAYGRVKRASPAITAAWLAAAAFVVVYLVPFVKYPGSPPSVGADDTIEKRTLLYLAMVWISILAAVAAVRLWRTFARSLQPQAAVLLAALCYLVVVVVAGVALPGIHEVPADFPATTLWRFREASVGGQLVIWTTIGIVFGVTAQRVMTGRPIIAFGTAGSRAAPAASAGE